MHTPLKVLLTGFQAFLEHPFNPTEQIVHQFIPPPSIDLETIVLPVDFQQALPPYLAKLHAFQPQLILNLGLSASAPVICLEKIALNHYADRTIQQKMLHQIIDPNGETALATDLPLDQWAMQLCAAGIPSLRSNHAGSYLCNFIYYQSLHWAKQHQANALFIHLPYTTEMASQICGEQRKGYASLPAALMVETINWVITAYLQNNIMV